MRTPSTPSTLLFALSVALLLGQVAHAQTDRVRLLEGSVSGKVTAVTRLAVTIESTGKVTEAPADQIRGVIYGGEPTELSQARVNARNGRYEEAINGLSGLRPRDIDEPLVQAEVDYYRAYSLAKRAMIGEADTTKASKALTDFLRGNRDSFHYFSAIETLGELFVATGDSQKASKAFGLLANSPLESYRLKAGVLAGRAAQSLGDHADAIESFEKVISSAGDSPAATAQSQAATLGKATSLASTGQLQAGLELAQRVIQDADTEDSALQARGYNTIGRCYAEAGRTTDALLAFLHTDLLFRGEAESHAEALARLAELWGDAGKPDQAQDALRRLRLNYAETEWARQAL